MDDWDLLEHEHLPDNQGTLYLLERDGEFTIHVDGNELMAHGLHGSEDALADLACDELEELDAARILVGGLGMGFTLAAVLRRVGPAGIATVAELVPSVVRWNQSYPAMAAAAGNPLDDPRVVVHVGDVCELVEQPPAPWSAILLDVDNGPFDLTHEDNSWLYSRRGLTAAFEALIPGGILAIWSADNDPRLTQRLRRAGYDVRVVPFHEAGRRTPDRSGTQVLWVARRPTAAADPELPK